MELKRPFGGVEKKIHRFTLKTTSSKDELKFIAVFHYRRRLGRRRHHRRYLLLFE